MIEKRTVNEKKEVKRKRKVKRQKKISKEREIKRERKEREMGPTSPFAVLLTVLPQNGIKTVSRMQRTQNCFE